MDDDNNKMLIDAAHPEETRVAVLRENRVVEFDYESARKKPLKGNIYLAKVTRVEPSLQAAFVDYGGNRHGFLAFNEIHPDYYQIPVADRQALLDEEVEEERAASAKDRAEETASDADGAALAVEASAEDHESDHGVQDYVTDANSDGEVPSGQGESETEDEPASPAAAPLKSRRFASALELFGLGDAFTRSGRSERDDWGTHLSSESGETAEATKSDLQIAESRGDTTPSDALEYDDDDVESVGSEDALEELPTRKRRLRRQYKIQEVIKRRQVVLVQVVKEERGNKGAALTTYLSLAGRYTVLMPNTARGGGISRKITNPTDRKRLRKIADDLEVPYGMGLIIRTAGASRTKAEIKRDFEYLLRLWENVRDLTLKSAAPTLIYEDGDLIKRSIRDLYSKDIGEVLVAGDDAYRHAKDFMRMLMPSHAKNVKPYKEAQPLFTRFQIERQLNAMFSPVVTLRSGGYIVINQTEALVAIDVNSGRATREHTIEETALSTNLEAAEELSRQLKLRDLAGLVVVDFIDMEERRNNRTVERRLKECLKIDRARIQVGRISHFGLLEMSRQRLRTGVLEGSTSPCAHCQGTGVIRSIESVALAILRAVEETLMAGEKNDLTAKTSSEAALYMLNEKRSYIREIEERYGIEIRIAGDEHMQGANFTVERTMMESDNRRGENVVIQMDWAFDTPEETRPIEDNSGKNKRRRRQRPRDDRIEPLRATDEVETGQLTNDATSADEIAPEAIGDSDDDASRPKRPRRRGKRGGRRTRREVSASETSETDATETAASHLQVENEAGTDPVTTHNEPQASENSNFVAESGNTEPRKKSSPQRTRRPRRRTSRSNGNGATTGHDPATKNAEPPDEDGTTSMTFIGDNQSEHEPPLDQHVEASTEVSPNVLLSDSTDESETASAKKEPVSPVVPQNDIPAELAASQQTCNKRHAGEEQSVEPRRNGWWQRRN